MKNMRLTFLWSTALFVALVGFGSAANAQSDGDILAAKAAFERGDWRRLDALVPSASGHLLERYVRYWQIKSRLDDVAPETVEAFLASFPDGPLAERLRVDWLKALGKRGDWVRFASLYSATTSDDVEVACDAIQSQYQREGLAALAAAKPLFFTGATTP